MAEKSGLATRIAAIVKLSGEVTTLCVEYSAADTENPDIAKLQSRVEGLGTALKATQKFVESRDGQRLEVSQETLDVISNCNKSLSTIKKKLDESKEGNLLRRLSTHTLKWPWKSEQLDKIVSKLDRYEQIITLALQPDQRSEVLSTIVRGLDNVSHQHLDIASRIGCFSVPFLSNPNFINRPEILKWMKEQHDSHAGRIALVGKDGLGKSQMALHFAERMNDKNHECSVFWIDGSSKIMLEHSFRSLADTLQLPGRHAPKANSLSLVSDWLNKEKAGPWVMILDNVEENVFDSKDDDTRLAELLPSRRTGCLIVTTHSQVVAENLMVLPNAMYEVEAMSDAQAMRLFRGKINRTKLEDSYDANSARKLVRALDHCPLAISIAASFMVYCAREITVESYLDQFLTVGEQKGSLLNKEGGHLAQDEIVLAPVVAAWEITFKRIEQREPSATRLLSLMSLFNPQEIPILGLQRYMFDVDRKGRGKLSDDLRTLRKLALVSDSASGDTYQMHPLIQTCTRAWITQSGKMEYWKRRFLSDMTAQFPTFPSVAGNRSACQALLPHIKQLFDEEPKDDGVHDWTTLLRRCALYFRDTQRGETAVDLSKKALAKAEAVWGREDARTQNLIDHTALFLGHERRFQEEEALLAELVEMRSRTLGEEHTNTLTAMDLLADSYCKQERFEEAEKLFLSVIEKQKRTLGEDHHDTLITMRRLAGLYRKNDKREEALKLFTLLEKVNRESKDHQYDTDAVNLAIAHMDFRQYAEAEELLKPAVERLTRTRGHDDGLTLWATSVLAGVYKRQKRYKESIALAQWCLPLLDQVCGQDHQRTEYTRGLLASLRKA
ncbi:hypothetical protein BHE90_002558 [Fusarium euwallaceae]|uniref:NB-ARC domain-containing protein n=1 Tax=Fusarium euwallaceae TaxID=1147111 RepID=A0A430M4H1_9HYPO|nr:hypothetical protein BHE90_002558 [Fusarium euwallaceae]